jgi:phage major head subunit gpT-like protein
MIINTASLSALFTSYNAAFKSAFDGAPTDWQKVAMLVPSSSESNTYGFLGNFPSMRVWVGDRQYKDLTAGSYSITNLSWESTVEVPRTKIEDDQYGVFSNMAAEMGYTAAVHPDQIVFGLAALGASLLCYDGQQFLDAAHPYQGGTTGNYDAVGAGTLWYLLDTKRPLKPFIFQKRKEYKFESRQNEYDENVFKRNTFVYGVDCRVSAGFGLWQMAYGSLNTLNNTNFDLYQLAMMSLQSDEGQPLGIRPDVCLVGPSRYAAARALFEMPYLAGGASNPHFNACKVIVTPFLT